MSSLYNATVYQMHADSAVVCNEALCDLRAEFKLDRQSQFNGASLVDLTVAFLCKLHLASYLRNGASVFADRLLVSNQHSSPLGRGGSGS